MAAIVLFQAEISKISVSIILNRELGQLSNFEGQVVSSTHFASSRHTADDQIIIAG